MCSIVAPIVHFYPCIVVQGGANGGSKSTVPYVKYTHPSTDVGHISMNILSTNAFHRAVPRLGGKATDPPKKIPLVDIRPKDWNTVCPPTFLDYGPWQSFGVRYDSREASVDAGVHTSAIVDAGKCYLHLYAILMDDLHASSCALCFLIWVTS